MTSTFSPKLGIPLYEDPEIVSTANFNRPLSYLDGAVQHRDITARPFELRLLAYDAGGNRIEVTFGPGRAYFGLTMVEKTTTWQHLIGAPLPVRTYWVYLLPDGSSTANQTGTTPAGALPLAKVSTGGTVTALSWVDIRPEVGGPQTLAGLNAAGYTQGSVLFVGPLGTIGEDNPNLFWDDAANQLRLGAGTLLRAQGDAQVDHRLFMTGTEGIRFGGDVQAELTRSAGATLKAAYALEAGALLSAPLVRSTNAQGQAPLQVASTTVVGNLNADQLDGFHAGNVTGALPINNGTLNPFLNADQVDGYHVGHASGQVPVADGALNAGLNADLLDGAHGAIPATANTVAQRDANADLWARMVNMASAGNEAAAPVALVGYRSADNYLRRYPPDQIAALIRTIDGAGSGFDADLLRGMAPSGAGGTVAVANGTIVTNLNAMYLNNRPGSVTPDANNYVQRDAAGYAFAAYWNARADDQSFGAAPAALSGHNVGDYYHRWYDATSVREMIKTVDGAGSGLDSDYVRGYVPGNASGTLAIANGALVTALNANYLQGWDLSTLLTFLTNTGGMLIANAQLTLTTALQDVPGCLATATEQAVYLIIGTFLFDGVNTGGGGDADNELYGECATSYDGRQPGQALIRVQASDGSRNPSLQTVTQTWMCNLRVGDTVRLRAYKLAANTPGARVLQSHTKMAVLKLRIFS